MADKFVQRWGKKVEDGGYAMLPFMALQIATAGTYLAVIACCYKFTWAGPTFEIDLVDMAGKLNVPVATLKQHFYMLADGVGTGAKHHYGAGLITMESMNSSKDRYVDMSMLIERVNELAETQAELKRAARTKKQGVVDTSTGVVDTSDFRPLVDVSTTDTVVRTTDATPVVSIGYSPEEKTQGAAAQPSMSPVEQRVRDRLSATDIAMREYVQGILQALGVDEANVTRKEMGELRTTCMDFKNLPSKPSADDLKCCAFWKRRDPGLGVYGVAAFARIAVKAYPEWVAKGKPVNFTQGDRNAQSQRRTNQLSPDVYLPDGTIDPNGGWLS